MGRHKKYVFLAVLLAALILGRLFLFHTVRIEGTSMNNTLKSGDIALVVNMFGREPERGDIVECEFPGRGGSYVKRVIGLPGEYVEIRSGDTYINGQFLREEYVSSETEDYAVQLQADEYLLLGDNRGESYDSRAADIGPAKKEYFVGRLVFSLWPFKSML